MNCTDFTEMEINRKIEEALNLLKKNNSYLLECDLNERSITHILGTYLKQIFPKWDVDCEYNRDGHDTKKILNNISHRCQKNTKSDDSGKTVYPDIIIHKRGPSNSGNNLVVIEVKKENNRVDINCDIAKLRAFKGQLNYKYALFLLIKTGNEYKNDNENTYYKLTFH